MEYTLRVLCFTDVSKSDPDKARQGEKYLDKESQNKYKKLVTKKYPNHRRFWAGTLNLLQGSAQFFNAVKDVLQARHVKNKDSKPLYEVFMTNDIFKSREETAPGYLTAIMVLGYKLKPAVVGEGPATTSKRSEDKVGIKYRYSSIQIDVSKSTFKEAIERQKWIKDGCWINSIYDFYKTPY